MLQRGHMSGVWYSKNLPKGPQETNIVLVNRVVIFLVLVCIVYRNLSHLLIGSWIRAEPYYDVSTKAA